MIADNHRLSPLTVSINMGDALFTPCEIKYFTVLGVSLDCLHSLLKADCITGLKFASYWAIWWGDLTHTMYILEEKNTITFKLVVEAQSLSMKIGSPSQAA